MYMSLSEQNMDKYKYVQYIYGSAQKRKTLEKNKHGKQERLTRRTSRAACAYRP